MTKLAFKLTLRTGLVLGLLFALAAVPAVADEPIVDVDLTSNAVIFQARANAGAYLLRVTGPNDFLLERFVRGDVPSLNLDASMVDGLYNWELTAVPRVARATQAAMDRARQSGDMREISRMRERGELAKGGAQSGVFTVSGGAIVSPVEEKVDGEGPVDLDGEGPVVSRKERSAGVPTKDQVILDDLIVDGSICAGMDCVNGESFGFDTIRMKENNLRIKAQDTSNSASFPTVDWQLTFNDSGNGGANKFSIDDIDNGRTPFTIEASAPSHSLYVDDGGRIGLGTSTPVVEIHVMDGDSPTLRLEQDGSSGFTAQTFDVAANEANFFVRDVTNGSRLSFRIKPGAPTDSLFVAASGNVGLGTDSPGANLHVRDIGTASAADHATIRLEQVSSGQSFDLRANHTSGSFELLDVVTNRIPFKVRAGAAADALVVAPTGVGINIANVNAAAALHVVGAIYQGASPGTVLHADYVFEPDYELPSIEQNAAFMWKNKHLPAIPKREVGEDGNELVEIGGHRKGIVEELEKAHIYIEQLHRQLQQLEEQAEAKESEIAELKGEVDRIDRLERLVEQLAAEEN